MKLGEPIFLVRSTPNCAIKEALRKYFFNYTTSVKGIKLLLIDLRE